MIKLKIEAENGKDLREQLEALLGMYGGTKEINVEVAPTVQEEVTPPVEEKKKRTKKVEAPQGHVPEQLPKEEVAEEEVAEGEVSQTETVSKDLLIQAMLEKNRGGKKNDVKALLTEFGINRITELKESQYQDFYDKMSAL